MKYLDSHTFAFINCPIGFVDGDNDFVVHLPPRVPDEVFIVRSTYAAQLWNPTIVGTNYLCNWLDPGGRYAAMGFPKPYQTGSGPLRGFNILPISGANSKPYHDIQFLHPPAYSKARGDALCADMAYKGGGGDFYWQLWWLVDAPLSWPTNSAPNGADDLNTRILLNFDEYPSCWRDFSAYCHLTYLYGNSGIAKTPVKFGKGSLACINGGFRIPNAPDLVHGASDWTWETWVYPTNPNGLQIILGQGANYSPVTIQQSGLNFVFGASASGTSWDVANGVAMGSATLNTWQHLAAVRNGSSITLWKDGVQQGAAIPVTGALCSKGDEWTLGYLGSGPSVLLPWQGYLGETRFSNVARNPALFPPTVSYGGA